MSMDEVRGAFNSTNEAVYKYKTQQPMLGTIGVPPLKQDITAYQHQLSVYGRPYELKISDEAGKLNITHTP